MENLVAIFGSGLTLIILLFLIVVAILGFLLPFFVLRIRREMIELNEKAGTIISLLRGESPKKTKKADKWNDPYAPLSPRPPYGGKTDPAGGMR